MNIYSVIVTGFSDDKWLIFDPQNNEHGTIGATTLNQSGGTFFM